MISMQQVMSGDLPSPDMPHPQQGAFVTTTTGVNYHNIVFFEED